MDRHFVDIDYNETMDFFSSLKTGLIYIGGDWCKPCMAVEDILIDTAKECGVDTIYRFDPMFTNVYGEQEDLRDCKSLEIKMDYYKLVEKLGFKSNELVKDTLIPRIHLPFYAVVKFGRCEKYYFKELVKDEDGTLHTFDSKYDCKDEFIDNLRELMELVKVEDPFLM